MNIEELWDRDYSLSLSDSYVDLTFTFNENYAQLKS